MMDAAILKTLAELVGLEFEDRYVEGASAEEHAVGEHPIRPPDLLEVEGLFVELGHLFRIFRGDGDVAQLGHGDLLSTGSIVYPSTCFLESRSKSVRDSYRRVTAPHPTGRDRSGRIPAGSLRSAAQKARRRPGSGDRETAVAARRTAPDPFRADRRGHRV